MRRLLNATLTFCFAVWFVVPADARNVALVIGNSDYEHVSSLPNPGNDAADIGAALERIGFEVTRGDNLDYRAMRLALRDFAQSAAEADMVIVYFAGHGIEIDNTNYLIPVNAELRTDRDVEFEAIRLDSVIGSIADVPGLKVILVDACRNNPFLSEMTQTSATRSIGRGLGRIDPGGVLVGYAARGGTLALDGDGRNSPYAKALLQHIEEPGLELGKMFRKVRDTVEKLTDGYQQPFTYGSLPADDIFLVAAPAPVETPELSGAQPSARQILENEIIVAFGEAEAANTLAAWNRFFDRFGRYEFNRLVKIARQKRNELIDTMAAAATRTANEPWLEAEYEKRSGEAILDPDGRRQVQKALSMMGYDVGTPDGVFGPRTRSAIQKARFDGGLQPGAVVDRELLAILPNVVATEAMIEPKAKRYDPETLSPDLDPRLIRAISNIGKHPIRFGYFEGRLYVAVQQPGDTWRALNARAHAAGGHLVTINSAAENQFLTELFSSDERFLVTDTSGAVSGPMIGLYQTPGSPEPAGGWTWVTGEPLTYRGWSRGNPDNYMNRQHYARFWRKSDQRGTSAPVSSWDDVSGTNWASGYIIEIPR